MFDARKYTMGTAGGSAGPDKIENVPRGPAPRGKRPFDEWDSAVYHTVNSTRLILCAPVFRGVLRLKRYSVPPRGGRRVLRRWYHPPIPTFMRFGENFYRLEVRVSRQRIQLAIRGFMNLRRMWAVDLPGSRRRAIRLWMGMFSFNVGCWYASRPWKQRSIYR